LAELHRPIAGHNGRLSQISRSGARFLGRHRKSHAACPFHAALARRNDAQIAYLREPSIKTREAFEAAKTAEAVAREILDTDVRWLASIRATTVIGLKLKALYASMEGMLADSIVEDILRL
jgi:hypothetical protein